MMNQWINRRRSLFGAALCGLCLIASACKLEPDGGVKFLDRPDGKPPETERAAPSLSWQESWTQVGINKYISQSQDTWEKLAITTAAGCTITVRLTATGADTGHETYGYASVLDGSASTGSHQFFVSGSQSSAYTYTVPAGTHYLYFGYTKSHTGCAYNGAVTVEITGIDF